mmetsp:Transcript_124640/g.226248  ORF Transcript_124640/g.226248 Transcript_124640/m.226248 type:complete len:204 (-) Transcript_124640:324-935(-)
MIVCFPLQNPVTYSIRAVPAIMFLSGITSDIEPFGKGTPQVEMLRLHMEAASGPQIQQMSHHIRMHTRLQMDPETLCVWCHLGFPRLVISLRLEFMRIHLHPRCSDWLRLLGRRLNLSSCRLIGIELPQHVEGMFLRGEVTTPDPGRLELRRCLLPLLPHLVPDPRSRFLLHRLGGRSSTSHDARRLLRQRRSVKGRCLRPQV